MVHVNQADYAASRHGGLGIASFIIGVVLIFIDFGIFTIAAVLKATGQQTQASNIVLGACILLLGCFCLLGIGLGIAGAADRTSKKAFPVLGIILCAGVFLITAGLVTIGIMKVKGII
jgi:hypothetical protein